MKILSVSFLPMFRRKTILIMSKVYFMLYLCWVPVKAENVVVTVQGRLRGSPSDGYVSYTGIPYGTISNDTQRFKRAGLAPLWAGVRESQEPRCFPTSKPDDCLQLDVHVPSSGGAPWPVMVWIRGGSGGYAPGRLVREGVVVVFVDHRVGPLGFLCTKDENIPGNAGVKDVVAALQWVRDNIVAFRGNPAKVVVAGQGFGAAVVEATMLSPTAHGLYHGVILQSGTVLSPLAFNYDAGNRALILARRIGGDDDDAAALLDADIAELAATSDDLEIPFFPFGICKENAHNNEDQLISEAPIELLKRKKVYSVPMIIGYNSDEAYIFAYSLKQSKILKRTTRDLSLLAPEGLKFLSEREPMQVARQIKDAYFKRNIAMPSMLEYYRDAYFASHVHRSARLHASLHPVYLYQFSHNGTPGVDPEPGVQKTGAAHSDELAYLFVNEKREGNDGIVQERLVKLWTNFVKFLDPTPANGETKWQPVDPQNLKLLNIDTKAEMRSYPHSRVTQMWDDIFDKYYYSRGNIR